MTDMKTNIRIAMCPFCRSYNELDSKTAENINSVYGTDDINRILKSTENIVTCDKCGKPYYYEQDCIATNIKKDYAIISLPHHNDSVPVIKTALYKILGKDKFRFRCVREFIILKEKSRIFEHGLDDRIIELIKYNHVPSAKTLGKYDKIVLTNIDESTMTFTVYDGYDTPLSSHKVSNDAYYTYYKEMKDEILKENTVQWPEINLHWAEKYTKENIRL